MASDFKDQNSMVFVLGGLGFLGSAFVRALQGLGCPHQVIDLDNYQQFIGQRCQLLINADGNSKKYLARKAPLEDFDASVRSVRASLVDFRFDRYLYLSSSDVYPDSSTPDRTSETEPLDLTRQSPYGFHKYLAEQCVRQAARNWLILRLGGFVGSGLRKNAIHDVLAGSPLWLDPESELQFMNTDTLASVALDLAGRELTGEVINVCGQGIISIREVMEITGREEIPIQPGSPRVRCEMNLSKLTSLANIPHTQEEVREFLRSWRQYGS